MSPHLAGRLTLEMMNKTAKARQEEKGEFEIAKDNEFDKVRQLLEK